MNVHQVNHQLALRSFRRCTGHRKVRLDLPKLLEGQDLDEFKLKLTEERVQRPGAQFCFAAQYR